MDEVSLTNFRCFRESQTARLAPLTFLVGVNSAGKTSFMAMLRALWDVAYANRVPDFKEEPYDLGSFDEIAHHRGSRGSRADEIIAGFKLLRAGSGEQPLDCQVVFRRVGTAPTVSKRTLRQGAARIEVRRGPAGHFFEFGTQERTWKQKVMEPLGDETYLVPLWLVPYFLEPEVRDIDKEGGAGDLEAGDRRSAIRSVRQIATQAKSLHEGEQAIRPYASAPVRSKPRRTYDPARPARDPEGDYVPMYLASKYFGSQKEWQALRDGLEKFGRDAELFDELAIKSLGKRESAPFQVQIRKFSKNLKGPPRNLIDVGYGVSQVLPIITEVLRPDPPSMFLLQQPEVHLHPSAQAALGSLFCQTAALGRRLVIETHSDHLLDRVRMDVRDGTTSLTPDDVSILFFERGELDVRIHSLSLDDQGNVLDAPDSYRQFFMQEMTRSLGL